MPSTVSQRLRLASRLRTTTPTCSIRLIFIAAPFRVSKRYGAAHGRALHVSPQRRRVVEHGLVLRQAVVPHQQVAGLPIVAVDELRPDAVLEQEIERSA